MMKKYRLTQCVLAALLGLTVALLACACASEDANVSQEQSVLEPNNDTSVLERSEINAESSTSEAESVGIETESIVTSDETSAESEYSDESEYSEETVSTAPTAPVEPTYPEERETTLELVGEYPLGEGGIPFEIFEGEDPAYKKVDFPDWFFADEQGKIYAFTGMAFYDLQSGKKLEIGHAGLLVSQVIAQDGKLYGWNTDGAMTIYTMQDGKVGSIKYPKRSRNGMSALFVSPTGKPNIVVDGVFFDENGKQMKEYYALDYGKNRKDTLNLLGREYVYTEDFNVLCYADGILTAFETQSREKENTASELQTGGTYTEYFYDYILYQYDQNGEPLSEFMIRRCSSTLEIACEISVGNKTCTKYKPISYIVGEQVFDNLLDGNWFVGADGTIYLMLIDLDGGKLYKINPGYSDVTFEEDVSRTEIQ